MSAGNEALELALGLLRAPARRDVLRARPLPEGITEVLAVASGSTGRLRAAAARTGARPEELLEAARFFVQQVMLTGDGDAYRVLGVVRGVGDARVREHHRLLQRWLHPDRSGEQWESAFSARVNWAWTHLRSDSARRAYDARREAPAADVRPATGGWRPPPAIVPGADMQALGAAPRESRAAPLAVLAVALLCLLLIWLVVRSEAPRDIGSDPDPDPPPSAAPLAPAKVAPDPGAGGRVECADVAGPVCGTAMSVRAPSSNGSTGRAAPAGAGAIAAPTAAGVPSEFAEPAEQDPVRAPAPHPAPAAPIVAASGESRSAIEAPAMPDPVPLTALANAAGPVAAPESLAVLPTPEPTPADDPQRLLQEAEHAIGQIAAYLAARDILPPPVWSDLDTQTRAADLRNELHARLQGGGRRRMELHAPHWRIGAERAVFDGGYRVDGWRSGSEDGVLHVELTRREQRWLASGLHMEPSL